MLIKIEHYVTSDNQKIINNQIQAKMNIKIKQKNAY